MSNFNVKAEITIAELTGLVWIVTWFLAIWVYLLFDRNIGIALFLTGGFALVLCMLSVEAEQTKKHGKDWRDKPEVPS